MDVERKPPIKRLHVGTYFCKPETSDFCIGGRFVVNYYDEHINIIDTFHSRISSIPMHINPTLRQGNARRIDKTFFLDLNTLLVIFYDYNDGSSYIGIGMNDLRSITVESAIRVDVKAQNWKLIGQTTDSNLRDGVYASYFNYVDDCRYVVNIKADQKDQLCLSQPMKLPIGINEFGLIDGHIYGFLGKTDMNVIDFSKTVKLSVESSAQETLAIENSTMLFEDAYIHQMVCVGWKLYVICYSAIGPKSRLVTLDLKTLKWNKTHLEFYGLCDYLKTDRKRTLIVAVPSSDNSRYSLYRFIVEQPDSLWNLASMAIKRQSELDFRYRAHILGNLPENSKFRCPLPVEY